MALAVGVDELVSYLERLPAERQRQAFDFIKALLREDEPDEVDVHESMRRALADIRAGRVDRRPWREVLDDL